MVRTGRQRALRSQVRRLMPINSQRLPLSPAPAAPRVSIGEIRKTATTSITTTGSSPDSPRPTYPSQTVPRRSTSSTPRRAGEFTTARRCHAPVPAATATARATTIPGGGTGSATTTVRKPAYVWNDSVSAESTWAWGTYLINFQAFIDIEDGSGNRLQCSYTSYDGQPNVIGSSSGLTLGESTRTDQYTNCGTQANSFNDRSGPITTTHTYVNFGNQQTTNAPDANARDTRHLA